MARVLESSAAVIDAVGGTNAMMRLTQRNDPRVVSNWRTRGLPPDTYLIVQEELRRLHLRASPQLWGIKEPDKAAS